MSVFVKLISVLSVPNKTDSYISVSIHQQLCFICFLFFQIQSLVTDSAGQKLLVLSGQSSDHGGLLLQTGVFTYQTFLRVFTDPGVSLC